MCTGTSQRGVSRQPEGGMLVGGWKGGSVEVHKLEGDVVLKLYVI